MTTETLTTPVMQKNVTVKVYNTVTKTYEVIELTKDGKTTTIKATKNVNYEFFDHSIGRAPNHIITRRVGKDLRISFERQGQEDDLIIEDFYEIADQSHSLIGIAEDDGYYYYIPDTGEVPDYVTQLADGDAEGHALGGERLAAPLFILPPPVGFPWWLATGIIPFLPRKDKDKTVVAGPEVGDFSRVAGAGKGVSFDLTKQDLSVLSGSKPIDWSTVQFVDANGNRTDTITTTDGVWTLQQDASGKKTGVAIFTPHSPYYTGNPDPVNYTVNTTDGQSADIGTIKANYPKTSPDNKSGELGKPVVQNVIENDEEGYDKTTVKLIDPVTHRETDVLVVPGQGTWEVEKDPVTGKSTGNIIFTPEPGFTANPTPASYVVYVQDPATGLLGRSNITGVAVTYPSLTTADHAEGRLGQPVTQKVTENDDNVDPTTLQLVDPITHGLTDKIIVPGEGTWTWTLVKDPTGTPTGEVTFTPESGFHSSPTPITYVVKKSPTDTDYQKPTPVAVSYTPILSPDVKAGNPGEPVTQNVVTNDSREIDPKTVELIDPITGQASNSVTVPNQGTWTTDGQGNVTFTPEPNFKGDPDPIKYKALDKNGNLIPETTVDVAVALPAPVLAPDSKVGEAGKPVMQDIASNDDAELDPTTLQLIDPKNPSALSDTLVVAGEGTWTLDKDPATGKPNGNITFTPEAGFMSSPTTIQYTGKDKNGRDIKPTTVDIVVSSAPTTPATSPDSKVGKPGNPVTQNVTSNDGNDIDPASIKLIDPKNPNTPPSDSVTVPGQGTWTLVKDPTGTPTGEVTFTPEPNFKGDPDPITYTGKDKNGNDIPPTGVDVIVSTPTTPTVPDTAIGQPGNPVTQNVTSNDGNDIDPASIKLIDPKNPNTPPSDSVTVPGQGTWTLVKDPTGTPTGEVTFTPEPNFKGDPDPITYTGKDKNGNDIPPTGVDVIVDSTSAVALPDSKAGTQGQPVTQNVTNNDGSVKPETVKLIDPISGTLTDKVVVPNEGTWTLKPGTDEVTFTPNPDFKDSPKPINYIVVDNITGTTLPPTPVNVVYPQDVLAPATVAISAVKPSSVEGQTPADTLEFKLTLTDTDGQVGSADVLVRADNASVVRKEDIERVSIDGQEVNIDDFFGKGVEVKGVTTNKAPVIVLTVKDDNLPENSELVSLTISTTTNGVLVTQPTATGVIKDEPANQDPTKPPYNPQDPTNPNNNPEPDTEGDKPVATLTGLTNVNEGVGAVQYTVKLNKAPATDTEVVVSVTDGKAKVDEDYTGTTYTVTIKAGETTASFEVPIVNDDNFEGAEDYTVAITSVAGQAITTNDKQKVTTTIHDDGTSTTDGRDPQNPNNHTDPKDPTSPIKDPSTPVNPLDNDAKPPVAVNDTKVTDEDTPVTGNVLDNDTKGTSPTLTVKGFSVDTNGDGTVEPFKPGETATIKDKDGNPIGELTIKDNGDYSFTPAKDWNGKVPTVTYTAIDGANKEDPSTLDITVTPVSDKPVATPDEKSTPFNTPVTIPVLDNDNDPDSPKDELTVKLVDPNNPNTPTDTVITPDGTYKVTPDNKVTFTPTDGFTGTPTTPITYVVTDKEGNTSTPTPITVTVGEEGNTAPNAEDNATSGNQGKEVTGNVITDEYAGKTDSDPENDALEVTSFTVQGLAPTQAGESVEIPNVGSLTINKDGSYSFTPVAEFNGKVPEVSYTIKDAGGLDDTAVLNIDITAKPVTTPDNANTPFNTPVTIPVLDNDNDPDSPKDELTVKLVDPNNPNTPTDTVITPDGTYKVTPDNKVTFTPTDGFTGTPTTPITYVVTDKEGNTSTPTPVTVTVADKENTPPVAENNVNSALEDQSVTGNVITDTSPEGKVDSDDKTPVNELKVTKISIDNTVTLVSANSPAVVNVTDKDGKPAGTLTVKDTGEYSFTPVENWNGEVPEVTYTITDGQLTADAKLNITVNPVPDAPIADDNVITVKEGTSLSLGLTNPKDPDTALENIDIVVTKLPEQGEVVKADGTPVKVGDKLTADELTKLEYKAPKAFEGDKPVVFEYTTTDDTNLTDTGTVTINVKDVPEVSLTGLTDVNEAVGSVEYTIHLDKVSDEPTIVTLEVTNGSAKAGEDYTKPTTLTVRIPAGETTTTVNVAITDDEPFEGAENYIVHIAKTENGLINKDKAQVTTTIHDDGTSTTDGRDPQNPNNHTDPKDPTSPIKDPSTPVNPLDNDKPTLTVGDASAKEGEPLVHTITLSNPSEVAVTYPFTIQPGTATEGNDYTPTPTFSNPQIVYNPTDKTITVPAGVTAFTVSYPTNSDTTAEPAETVKVTVGGKEGTGTINDGNTPMARIETSTTVAEVDGYVFNNTITLDTGVAGTTEVPFTVEKVDETGKATLGTDYEIVLPANTQNVKVEFDANTGKGKVTFTNTTQATSIELGIKVKGDATFEGKETFSISLDKEADGAGYVVDTAKQSVENAIVDDGSVTNDPNPKDPNDPTDKTDNDKPTVSITGTPNTNENGTTKEADGSSKTVPTYTIAIDNGKAVIAPISVTFKVVATEADGTLTAENADIDVANIKAFAVDSTGTRTPVTLSKEGDSFKAQIPVGSKLEVETPLVNDKVYEGAETYKVTLVEAKVGDVDIKATVADKQSVTTTIHDDGTTDGNTPTNTPDSNDLILTDDYKRGIEDTTLTVEVANGVLANDNRGSKTITSATFNDGTDKPITLGVATPITKGGVEIGKLTLSAEGAYTFVPATNYSGAVPPITYTVDGKTAQLQIDIAPQVETSTISLTDSLTNKGVSVYDSTGTEGINSTIVTVNAQSATSTVGTAALATTTITPERRAEVTQLADGGAVAAKIDELLSSGQKSEITAITPAVYRGTFADANNDGIKEMAGFANGATTYDNAANNDPTAPISQGVVTGTGRLLQTWVYLKAGSQVAFKGYADDGLKVELAGKDIVWGQTNDSWGNFDSTQPVEHGPINTRDGNKPNFNSTGVMNIQEDGYYSLNIYNYNSTVVGGLDITMTTNGADYFAINTDNFDLYKSMDDVTSQYINKLKTDLRDNKTATVDKDDTEGYYVIHENSGYVGDSINLQSISISTPSVDNSGTPTTGGQETTGAVTITGLPAGAVITDGAKQVTVADATTGADVTGFDLTKLSVSNINTADTYTVTVSRTDTDTAQLSDKATSAGDTQGVKTNNETHVAVHSKSISETFTVKVMPRINFNSVARVSEEGLQGGKTDETPTTFDKTNSTTNKGAINITGLASTANITLELLQPTTVITSQGKAVTWASTDNGTTWTATRADDNVKVMTITIGEKSPITGGVSYEYTTTLFTAIDHKDGLTEDNLGINFGVVVKDGTKEIARDNQLVTVVEDDAPVAVLAIHTIDVPRDKITFSDIQTGFRVPTSVQGTVTPTDNDKQDGNIVGKYEVLEWGTSYNLSNDTNTTITDKAITDKIDIVDFTHINRTANGRLYEGKFDFSYNVNVNGQTTTIKKELTLQHVETYNAVPSNGGDNIADKTDDKGRTGDDFIVFSMQQETYLIDGKRYVLEMSHTDKQGKYPDAWANYQAMKKAIEAYDNDGYGYEKIWAEGTTARNNYDANVREMKKVLKYVEDQLAAVEKIKATAEDIVAEKDKDGDGMLNAIESGQLIVLRTPEPTETNRDTNEDGKLDDERRNGFTFHSRLRPVDEVILVEDDLNLSGKLVKGADRPSVVNWSTPDTDNDITNKTPTLQSNGDKVFTTIYGDFTANTNGSYNFVAKGNLGELINNGTVVGDKVLNFDYDYTDSDGDKVSNKVVINIKDYEQSPTAYSGANAKIGTANHDYLKGTTNAGDVLMGMGGDDTLEGYAGADRLDGGAGNDYFLPSYTVVGGQITALEDTIIGGTGFDTLLLRDQFYNNNGIKIASDFNTSLFAGKVTGIEEIDMTNGTAQTLTIRASDVLAISDNEVSNTDTYRKLFVKGDKEDSVTLTDYRTTGNQHTDEAGSTYNVYTATNGTTLYIDTDIQVL